MGYRDSLLKLANWDRLAPWSLAGCAVGVASFALSIYLYVLSQQHPALSSSVVCMRIMSHATEVAGLRVTRNGEDLTEKDKNISVIAISLTNSGNVPIRIADFDPSLPLGIRISKGSIIGGLEVSEPSEKRFLKSEWIANLNGVAPEAPHGVANERTEISLPPFTFDPSETVTFKCLIVHDRDSLPGIEFTGKIAGVSTIPVSLLTEGHEARKLLFFVGIGVGALGGCVVTLLLTLFIVGYVLTAFVRMLEPHIKKMQEALKPKQIEADPPNI